MSKLNLALIVMMCALHSVGVENDTGKPKPIVSATAVGAKDYFERGTNHIARNEWDQAIEDFSNVIRLDSSNCLAFEYRGSAYGAKGDLNNGISDYTEAIKLDSTIPGIFYNRGTAYLQRGNLDEALADFNKSLQMDPNQIFAHMGRATIYKRTGQVDKAIEDCNEVERLNPKEITTFKVRANLFERQRKFDKAIQDHRSALQLNSKETNVLNDLAWLLATCPTDAVRAGGEAVALATKACELTNWKNAQCIDTLAAAFAETGNFEKAVNFQNQALKIAFDKDLKEMKDRLSLYEKRRPFRQNPKASPNGTQHE